MARWVPSPGSALAVFLVARARRRHVAGIRGLAAYRVLRSFQRQLDAAVDETTRLIDGIEPRVAKATATAQRLEEARARLEESAATREGALRRVRRGARARAARHARSCRVSAARRGGRPRDELDPAARRRRRRTGRSMRSCAATTVTRLGEGVDASRRLLPAAIERVHAALARVPARAGRARRDARARGRDERRARLRERRRVPPRHRGARSASRRGCSTATRRRG